MSHPLQSNEQLRYGDNTKHWEKFLNYGCVLKSHSVVAQAWKLHKESRLLDMKDPSLVLGEDEGGEVQRVLETAVVCVQTAPEKRPSMFLVAAMLAGQGRRMWNVDALPSVEEAHESSQLAALRALLWKNVLTTEFPC